MPAVVTFAGPVWRLVPEALAETPAAPARAPEGRFHHGGQVAAYASLTVEGTVVAIQRYLGDGVRRVLVPMWLEAERVVDARGNPAASLVWQETRAADERPSTWDVSDFARAMGGQAMLYSSRSRPDLSHVVVFDPGCLTLVGPITPWSPE